VKRVISVIVIGLVVPTMVWAERFKKNGDLVYDSKTELTWQSSPSSQKFNWSDAQNYCNNLSYGGQSDWRLPNIYELKSLVDYTKYNPAIAIDLINIDTDYPYYWSSSKDIDDSSHAWNVNFKHGYDLWNGKSFKGLALCVR